MPESDVPRPRIFRTKKVLITLAAVISITAVVSGLVFAGFIPLSGIVSCLGTAGTSRSFSIVADLNGYNESKTLVGLGIWPIMNASRCDNVTINFRNNDTQSHGLAVGGYTGEFSIAAGETFSIHFTVNKIGHWRVFCTILCTVHDYMQNGQLNVT